jgi:hypothetical protein
LPQNIRYFFTVADPWRPKPVGQPVFDRLAHGVVVTAEGESVLVVAQLLTELALRFGLGPDPVLTPRPSYPTVTVAIQRWRFSFQ